jgi:hypothetical protein
MRQEMQLSMTIVLASTSLTLSERSHQRKGERGGAGYLESVPSLEITAPGSERRFSRASVRIYGRGGGVRVRGGREGGEGAWLSEGESRGRSEFGNVASANKEISSKHGLIA